MSEPVLDLLRELLAKPSVTPEDAGCQALVGDRLSKAGFSVRSLRFGDVDNLWATHGAGQPLVCLAGHTDVVPAGDPLKWTSPPFEPEIREGKLFGRGASDMKGSVAAMTIALDRVAKQGHLGMIALLLTSDEEGKAIDGTRRVLEQLSSEGQVIDAAIVGEPTSESIFGDVVKVGRRGSMTGEIRVSGVQGHTAYPQLAINAVHRLAPALADLARLKWEARTQDFPATTLQVSNLSAGTGASNVIPGDCRLQFNVRHGTDYDCHSIMNRLAAVFRDHGITEEIAWTIGAAPFLTQPGTLMDSVAEAVREVTGSVPTPSTGGGTSDARFFAHLGVPVVEFGPLNDSIHAVNENIEVGCLEPLAEIYAKSLLKLCSAEQF